MVGEKFQSVLNRLSLEEFKDYYFNHNQVQTKEHFNISWGNLSNYIKYFNITKSKKDIRKASSSTCKKKSQHKLIELSNKIPLDTLIDYYTAQNHTTEECTKHFNISNNQFFTLLKFYNYHKPKESLTNLIQKTKLERYGDVGYNNRDKAKETCLEKYGVDNCSKIKGAMEKAKNTKKSIYGNCNNFLKIKETRIKNFGSFENSYRQGVETSVKTCLAKYGVTSPMKLNCIKEKAQENFHKSFKNKYGVSNYWELEDAKRSNGSKNSSFNIKFAMLLKENSLEYTQEFNLKGKWFDFKLDNILIEINPSPTHNISWSPYKNPLDKEYHANKTKLARDNGYRCLNIWDWDDQNKIIESLKPKQPIQARKCIIKEISNKEAFQFEDLYHFQGKCYNQNIRLGLFYKDELVQIMTFGKPRYNKNYEYELLRLCTRFNYYIIGGSEKLFNYFLSNYKPTSIISYCDYSKFNGDVYLRLGMSLKAASPSVHWFNLNTQEHILDSLLRKQGFDRLLGSKYGYYGKGTSNEELMLKHGFVQIYDSGQASYFWHK